MIRPDSARDPVGAAVAALEACRTYPVPAKVEKQIIRWAKTSADDARAASMLVRLTHPPTVDALIRLLEAAAPNDGLALDLAHALLGLPASSVDPEPT